MKKLIFFLPILALFSLVFISCQSTDNITSPEKDLAKSWSWSVFPNGVTSNVVPLVSGQDYAHPIGAVTITYSGGTLTLSYNLNNPDCKLTEIHVDLAKVQQIYGPTHLDGLHVNSSGNPVIGNFDFSQENPDGFALPYSVQFTAAQLQAALGGTAQGTILVGAHGIACCPGDGGTGTPIYCPDLSQYVQFSTEGAHYNPYVFYPVKVYDANGNYLTEFPAWCVDHIRSFERNVLYNARFISTACNPLPSDIGCIIDLPQNLDLLNYLLNNFDPGNTYPGIGSVTTDVYQAVIWLITDGTYDVNTNFHPDTLVVSALYNYVASQGEGYIPQCGDKMAIIVVDANWDYCNNPSWEGFQPLIIWKTVECVPEMDCETCWAIPLLNGAPNEAQSNLYPGHVWFRYFGYTIP